MKNPLLDEIIGRTGRTGGVAESYSGPHESMAPGCLPGHSRHGIRGRKGMNKRKHNTYRQEAFWAVVQLCLKSLPGAGEKSTTEQRF